LLNTGGLVVVGDVEYGPRRPFIYTYYTTGGGVGRRNADGHGVVLVVNETDAVSGRLVEGHVALVAVDDERIEDGVRMRAPLKGRARWSVITAVTTITYL
jgi:hypothetical protein